MEIINENVVNLIIALKRLEDDFTKEFNALDESGQCEDCESINDDFWNGYTDMMRAFKGLLLETIEINVDRLIICKDERR